VSDENIIKRPCAGDCGAVLHYVRAQASALYTPDVTCLDGVTAYRGGHLCVDCAAAVAAALARRRGAAGPTSFGKRRVRTSARPGRR
jgi:hypothetical protein